ncbi:ribosome silencing factor [Phaeocystidibacter luteus]|uniref:Ribosomal silencing factor RsfS n=1 Tax=Phaeocystidibacter luteus TaxID=911197 RepID=A0A6N6RD61_9FLAO|nr:ribosome silencing factor [Phaeocystidibacter luteus]KAB2806805.1 ribosome silencing factor [Phaeocystidibacter luteus]
MQDQPTFPALIKEILEGIQDNKGKDITIMDLTELENSVCDYFVITTGNSTTQVKSISEAVEKRVREELGDKPWHVEGADRSEWVLMDYVNAVVHVFQQDSREFYDLESLWGDAKIHHLETEY